MKIINFDVGYSGLVFQFYLKHEGAQYSNECKLTIHLASDINECYCPPQDITIYGKDALIKLRDKLLEVYPLIEIKNSVKKYTLKSNPNYLLYDEAYQLPISTEEIPSPDWPKWLIDAYTNLECGQFNTVYKSDVKTGRSILTVKTPEEKRYVYPGDWIVRSSTGDLFSYSSEEFKEFYEKLNKEII